MEVSCYLCFTTFHKRKKKTSKKHFCSRSCHMKWFSTQNVTLPCEICKTPTTRRLSQFKRSKSAHIFCGHPCAATYVNLHKTTGIRRSKLEIWLETKLKILYPNLQILFNDKTTINSELDIYFPTISLAVELNGVFHYEPIYGPNKLEQIQSNDSRKFQACLEKGIELLIINTSKHIYFKEKAMLPYLKIIQKIVDSKVNRLGESNSELFHPT